MNAKTYLLRWPWWVLIFILLFLSAAAWSFVKYKFNQDLLLARNQSERDMQLIATFLSNELQANHYQDTERLLHEWGNADEDVAQLRLVAANGFVLASFQRLGESKHSLTLQTPISYSYRQNVMLYLRTDLAKVYQRRDRLALEFIAILLVLSALLFALTCFAMLRQREAMRLRQRTHELDYVNRKLTENDERLRLALDAGRMGVFDWDVTTNFVVWSPEHAQLFGMRPEDFDGRYESFTQRIHPEDLPGFERTVEIARLSHSLYQREFRIIWPDGTQHWISGHGHFLYAENGQAVRMTGVVMNVDERKQADAVLEESERRFRAVLEDIQLIGVMLDREGRIVLCNDFLLALTGWKRDEVLRKDWFEVFLPPKNREKVRKSVFQESLRVGNVPAHYENEIVTRGGELLCVAWSNILLRNSQGEIVGVTSIGEDISARRKIEQALMEKQRLLTESQRIAHIGSWSFLLATNEITWSEETYRVYGVAPDFAINLDSFIGLIHADDRAALSKWMEDCIAGRHPAELEFRIVPPDGDVRVLSGRGVLEHDAENRPLRMYGTVQDVTDRRRAKILLKGERSVLGMMAEDRPLTEILEAIARYVETLSRDMLCSILLLDADGVHLRQGAAPSLPQEYNRVIDGSAIGPNEGSCGTSACRNQPVIVTDIAVDPLWADYRALALQHGLRACWSTPIRSASNHVLGTFALYYHEPRTPGPADFELIERVTHLSAIAIERKRAEEALRQSEARMRAIFDTEPECVKLVAADGTLLQMNATGLAMIEAKQPPQAIGCKIFSLVAPEHRETYRAFHESVIRGNKESLEFEIIGLGGTRRWMETHAAPMSDNAGATVMLGISRDVTERKSTEARLNYLANYDDLTGLPNRVLFNDRLQQAIIDANRHERMVGVVFLDLDRFKNINDTLGHEKGDMLIKAVTERLIATVRKGDTVARQGGDEFTFVLADMAHVDDAARVAQKVLDAFSHPFNIAGRELFITASLGVTLYPFDDINIQGLLRNADIAMYRAKESGRNSYQFYTAEMTAKAAEFLALENDLRHALDRHELYLVYQPIADCRTGLITGAEVLLRWNHHKRGLLPPMQFIPLAEETGLIVPIGEWVLRTACAQYSAWQKQGLPPLRVAVNLSARQFDQSLAPLVEKILLEVSMDPRQLELEITETAIMQQTEISANALQKLNTLGVSFIIDDFGTGYSSLSYLKRFPIEGLKVDRSFVHDIPADADDAAIARAIITMAHSLGLKVVAEGVETIEQLNFMQTYRCDAMQGYYLSKPLLADQFGDFLKNNVRLATN